MTGNPQKLRYRFSTILSIFTCALFHFYRVLKMFMAGFRHGEAQIKLMGNCRALYLLLTGTYYVLLHRTFNMLAPNEETMSSDSSPVLKKRRTKRTNAQRVDSPYPNKGSTTRSLRSRNANKTPDGKFTHLSSSSVFDSGIESSCDTAASSQSSRYKLRTRIKNENFSPRLIKSEKSRSKALSHGTSTPCSSKKQPKDSDNCFGFEELILEDDYSLFSNSSPHKANRSSWLWSDDVDNTREITMPDPGLSPIKESTEEGKNKVEEFNASLFDENLDAVRPDRLSVSAQTYAKRSSRMKRNVEKEADDVSGYMSDENADQSLHKRRKVNRKHEVSIGLFVSRI